MIWFSCKQCGKVHGRAESSVGAMVFCDCGTGLRVPWESTTAPPAAPTPEPAPQRAMDPIRFETPSERLAPVPHRRERRSRHEPIDPNACFNHATFDKDGVCADCELSFCNRCLTTFRGQTYCAACKNYRTRLLQRRPENSKLAVMSFLLAMAAGPVMLIMVAVSSSRHAHAFLLLALLPPLLALAAGVLSLRWIGGNQFRGGQHLAISGIALGVVVGVMTFLMYWFGHKIMV